MGSSMPDGQPLGDGQATGRAAVRARTDWNSVVRRWGIVLGSARAPMNDSAPEIARYTAGASENPVLDTSHAATSGVVPPSKATPKLYEMERTCLLYTSDAADER